MPLKLDERAPHIARLMLAYADQVQNAAVIATAQARDDREPYLQDPLACRCIAHIVAAGTGGATAQELAAATNQADLSGALRMLRQQDIVEDGPNPTGLRLTARGRTRVEFLMITRLVGPGEVTTYGTISKIVHWDKDDVDRPTQPGHTVAQTIRTNQGACHLHRIVSSHGVVLVGQTYGTLTEVEIVGRLRAEHVPVATRRNGGHRVARSLIVDGAELERRLVTRHQNAGPAASSRGHAATN